MNKKTYLKGAGVLLLTAVLLLSATAVTANTNQSIKAVTQNSLPNNNIVWIQPKVVKETSSRDNWIHYDDGTCENSLGLTAGGTLHEAIKLTPTELAGYNGFFTSIKVMHGCPAYPGCPAMPYIAWMYTGATAPSNPETGATIVGTGTCPAIDDYFYINLTTPYAFVETDTVWIGVGWQQPAGTFPCGFDTDSVVAGKSDWLWYSGGGWMELQSIGYPGNWNLWVAVGAGGDQTPPVTTAGFSGTNPVTVTITATDDMSGVNHTYYNLDSAGYVEYAAPFDVSVPGNHTIFVYSVDKAGNSETPHSYTFTVAQPPIGITIKKGLGITATIKNTGTTTLTSIPWTIKLTGGIIIIGGSKSGTIASLAPAATSNAKDFVLGFGKTSIVVTAGSASATASGTVLLILII